MTIRAWEWNGARWWRFDFHTHTPASDDYAKGPQQAQLKLRTPKDWLLDYMRAGIDCVAITDHNSGAWVDKLRDALRELESERPEGYRHLHVFAGVEISVHGGVHLLAILGCDKTTPDIDSLLGAAGFSGTKGSSDAVTSKSFEEVVAEIERAGGIAIPAHADEANGLFTKLQGATLAQALDCKNVFAVEIVDPRAAKPALFMQNRIRWTELVGSESHHPTGNPGQGYPGSRFTWVKMGSPSFEGLRLALLDGLLSIGRSDQGPGDPNNHAPLVMECIEVVHARFMGHAQPFTLTLNPWLNAIIGGRGTGKSSLVEFLRLALRREGELKAAFEEEEFTREFEKYGRIYSSREDTGLLTDHAAIRVVYRKNGARFRVQWSPAAGFDAIQEENGGGWQRAEGDVSQRFPIRMYSQKQIFHLARAPLALLGIVDEAPDVDRRSWNERWKEEEGRFLSLRAKAREIEAGLAEEPRLKGELDDVRRKLAVFEEAGHADVLREFQKRSRQRRAVEAWQESWANAGQRLRELAADLVPDRPDSANFDPDAQEDEELRVRAEAARNELQRIRRELESLAAQADRVVTDWTADSDASAWHQRVDAALQGYEDLRRRLAAEGAGDPAAYGELVQRRQTLERRLQELDGRRKQVEELRKQGDMCLGRLLVLRRGLTESRKQFLAEVLKDNRFVRIQVVPYGARETVELELRRLLQREDGGFERDIGSPTGGGLLGKLYAGGEDSTAVERAIGELKQEIRSIAEGGRDPATLGDRRFATHLKRLPPETLDRIDLWFPEDSLDMQYSTTADGQRFRSIQEGSPGQKTAALLAFLLSYGEEPLVLDQPEDDLDNHLIYDLIVTQLREVKRRRQIVVVTHNPNIVVNGDAELVVALVARVGETQKECEGSLQEKQVRNTICEVMEGGREAFEQRYRRIALEGRHV
jgi:hypothetical protein